MNQKLPGQTTQNTPVQLPDKYYPPNVIRLSKIICAFITESKYTAIFYFYMLSIFYFFLFSLLFLIMQPRKKTTQKTCRPLQSLVRISTARADAHNTIAPFRHTSPSYKNKNNPSGTTCLFITYNSYFTLPALFRSTNYNNIYDQTNNRPKHSSPLTNMPSFRMSIISISFRRFHSTPKRLY
jgi:hypothetical protein